MATLNNSRMGRAARTRAALLVLCYAAMAATNTLGQDLGVIPWRPREAPERVQAGSDSAKAVQLVQGLSHTKTDVDQLWEITLAFAPSDAVQFLNNYASTYASDRKVLDEGWGRAIFCLALVQSEDAKKRLFDLWETYDQRLAKGEIELVEHSLGPLAVIGDALHFYLWDPQVRAWFIAKIAEGEKMPRSSSVQDWRAFVRRRDRIRLLFHLYRWDLVESVDGEPYITPERVTATYPFAEPYPVKNVAKSAAGFVYWVRQLKPLAADVTEEVWISRRQSEREYTLDEVAYRIGRPLAQAVWDQYLKEPERSGVSDVRCRLWCTVGAVVAASLCKEGTWVPSEAETALLVAGATYAEGLPPGLLRDAAADEFFKATCFVPDERVTDQVRSVRNRCGALMSEDARRGAVESVARARQELKARSQRAPSSRPR